MHDMERLQQSLVENEQPLAVVGLGYVGLPLAVHMSAKYKVIGFDINESRIARLNEGVDDTGEVSDAEMAEALKGDITFTCNASDLAKSKLIIVAVPTPIDDARHPDLRPLRAASKTVGAHMAAGTVVVFESTVYPGATEEICTPVLEEESGLRCGEDFFLGYSPERINPGDKVHTFTSIKKVVSGQTPEVLKLLSFIYGSVVEAGIHEAADIKTAEAAKVIENTQRDLNIALMNELAIIFNSLDIDTHAVLEAAGTKWNFLKFWPGLVGGHCIGVDPYYLTYQAERVGHHPEVILAGRRINDHMSKFVAEQTVKNMVKNGLSIKDAKVLVLGITFKEDVPDLRNSKVVDVVKELREYQMEVLIHDPYANNEELMEEYGESLTELSADLQVDAIVYAVQHQEYRDKGLAKIASYAREGALLVDVKGAVKDPQEAKDLKLAYWRL